MVMGKDIDHHQGDILLERERKSHLRIKEHQSRYLMMSTWPSVKDIVMRQMVSSSGKAEEETLKINALCPWTKQHVRF